MTDPALFDLHPTTSTRPTPPPAPIGGLPAHVRRHLEAIGQANPDGIGRTIAPRRCDRCHAEVLVGLDGPIAARAAIADPIEVDEIGEALAIATGRARWWIGSFPNGRNGSTWQFVPRWIDHIGKPFRGPVFIEHKCGAPPPPTATTRFRPDPSPRRNSDIPDF